MIVRWYVTVTVNGGADGNVSVPLNVSVWDPGERGLSMIQYPSDTALCPGPTHGSMPSRLRSPSNSNSGEVARYLEVSGGSDRSCIGTPSRLALRAVT